MRHICLNFLITFFFNLGEHGYHGVHAVARGQLVEVRSLLPTMRVQVIKSIQLAASSRPPYPVSQIFWSLSLLINKSILCQLSLTLASPEAVGSEETLPRQGSRSPGMAGSPLPIPIFHAHLRVLSTRVTRAHVMFQACFLGDLPCSHKPRVHDTICDA